MLELVVLENFGNKRKFVWVPMLDVRENWSRSKNLKFLAQRESSKGWCACLEWTWPWAWSLVLHGPCSIAMCDLKSLQRYLSGSGGSGDLQSLAHILPPSIVRYALLPQKKVVLKHKLSSTVWAKGVWMILILNLFDSRYQIQVACCYLLVDSRTGVLELDETCVLLWHMAIYS